MTFINGIVSKVFDLMLGPWGDHASWAMIMVAAVTGVWALWLFKIATPQTKLARQRDRLLGHIYEMGMYQDHLGVLARIQRDLALANLRYLSLTLPALVVLLIPMVLTLAQLDGRFAHRPLRVGETTVLQVTLRGDHDLAQVGLDLPPGVAVVAGPVRDQSHGDVVWRLQVAKKGAQPVAITLSGQAVGQVLVRVGKGLPLLGYRISQQWWEKILFPGTETLRADSPVQEIELAYPERQISYLGVELDWLLAFMVFSLVAGLAIKGTLGVEM